MQKITIIDRLTSEGGGGKKFFRPPISPPIFEQGSRTFLCT